MKHAKLFLIVAAMLLGNLPVRAEYVAIGDFGYELNTDTKEATLITVYDYSYDVVIPSTVTYDGVKYNVTTIGDNAFYECYNLNSVTIPEGVDTIEHEAFYCCRNLKSVVIPKSVKLLGREVFKGCRGLRSITIPGGVLEIVYGAFGECYSLEKIIIETGTDKLLLGTYSLTSGKSLFQDCPLKEVYIGRDLSYKHTGSCEAPFEGIGSLSTVVVGEGVTRIEASLFSGCSNLSSLTLPESLTSMNSYAFRGCSSLTSLTLPENLIHLGVADFEDCSKLSSVTILGPMTDISQEAFANCKSLESFTIPESVTVIGPRAFKGCEKLASITIPDGIVEVREEAFSGTAWYENLPNGVTYVGKVLFEYRSKIPEAVEVKDETVCIADYAFSESSITSIVIPGSVKSIGYGAFASCEKLTSVTISEGVASIGEAAFSSCYALPFVAIPESVSEIWNYAFGDCRSLKTIQLPKNQEVLVGEKVFDTYFAYNGGIDVFCDGMVSSIWSDWAFYWGEAEEREWNAANVTLHVPKESVQECGYYWPCNIVETKFNPTSITLTEGEFETLYMTASPNNILLNFTSASWNSSNPGVATVDAKGNVKAIAPGTAVVTVTDGSGVSNSCEVVVKEKLLGICTAPTISYAEGKVQLFSNTEDVEFVTEVIAGNAYEVYQESSFSLTAAYTISAYAKKAKYENSDTVIVTLCWVECAEEHKGVEEGKGEDDGIINITSKPLLVQTNAGAIMLTGLAENITVVVYDVNGCHVGSAVAVEGKATISTNLVVGTTAIVKIGNSSIKIMLK